MNYCLLGGKKIDNVKNNLFVLKTKSKTDLSPFTAYVFIYFLFLYSSVSLSCQTFVMSLYNIEGRRVKNLRRSLFCKAKSAHLILDEFIIKSVIDSVKYSLEYEPARLNITVDRGA